MSYFEFLAGTQVLAESNLHNDLAKGVEKMLSEGLSKDISAQLIQKYETPTNCHRLAVLPCNPEVFKNSSTKAKSRDSALQNAQKALVKGLSAVIYAYDDFLQSPDGDTVFTFGRKWQMELPYYLTLLTPFICFDDSQLRVRSKISTTLCVPHPTLLQAHHLGLMSMTKLKRCRIYAGGPHNQAIPTLPYMALSFFRPTSAMELKRQREESKLPPTSSMATAAKESLPKKEMNVRSNAWHPVHCGGKLKYYWKEWVKYTSDRFVLSCVKGFRINFLSFPIQHKMPHLLRLSQDQELVLTGTDMVQKFVTNKVILKCDREEGDYVNNIFLREKRNTDNVKKKYRMILNLKHLNTHIEYVHFKMDSLESCLNLMEDNCFMASIDLADATTRSLCTLAIQNSSSLRSKVNFTNTWFYLRGTGTVLGTKITKPLISHLHERGILCSIYIDDLYVQGSTFEE